MKIALAVLITLGFLCAGAVYGHTGATGIIKERMDAMKDMGDKSRLVAEMFKGKVDFDRRIIASAADAFTLHGSSMTGLFPDTIKSRTGGNTEALPRIWEDWVAFNEEVDAFLLLSESLRTTVANTDDSARLRKVFFQTTKACSSCHKKFRKPKK